jgi:hypothetical protein
MNNKLIYIIILLLIIIAGGAYFIFNGAVSQTSSLYYKLSEQPNETKYDEYLSEFYLGKMAIGKKIGADGFPTKTNIFTLGIDQLCTTMTLKKTIPSGRVAIAIYDVILKQYNAPKTIFPMELQAGGSGGCSNLAQSTGKYEYKLYIDNTLAAVLPFEVK